METDTRNLTPTQPAAPPPRLCQVKVTRSHYLLEQRSAFVGACREALQNIASRLHGHLGEPVEFSARVAASAASADRLRDLCAFALFELSDAQTAACLEIDLPFLSGVLDAFAGGGSRSQAATRLTRVEEAAFGFLALHVVAALRTDETIRCRLGPGLSEISLDRAMAAERLGPGLLLAVEVEVAIGELQGRVRLLVPSRPLEAALTSLPDQRRTESREGGVALEAAIIAATTRLDAATVDALGNGDVVILEGLERAEDGFTGAARVEGPGFVLFGAIAPDGFHPERIEVRSITQEQLPMSKTYSAAEAATIPVDLEIELCRTRVQLGELAGLRAGSLLGLRASATEPVLVKVANRPIARAELVDLDGQLGARILEIFGDRP